MGCRGNVEVVGLCNYHAERFLYEQVGGQGNVEVLGPHNFYTERFLYEQVDAWSRYCEGF